MTINCFTDKLHSCQALAERICTVSKKALLQRGCFSLVLSGGSTPKALYSLLASQQWRDRIRWQRAHIFFGDERCVSPNHPDSNYKMARDSMLDKLPIAEEQIYRIRGECEAGIEAARYQEIIRSYFKADDKEPLFDLTLLGLGSDGHTASLFPGDPVLGSSLLVTPVTAPTVMRPAVPRISLTLAGLAMTRKVCFLVDGAAKAGVVLDILKDNSNSYPAALVRGRKRDWFLSGMDCTLFQD